MAEWHEIAESEKQGYLLKRAGELAASYGGDVRQAQEALCAIWGWDMNGLKSGLRVGLLGPDGTFTAAAGYNNANRRGYEIRPVWCKDITGCFESVLERSSDIACVPIVNSTSSAYQVNETMLCLRDYHEKGIRVYDEEVVPIAMQLAALPGVGLDDIKTVSSKDKAIQQCNGLAETLGHGYEELPTTSTAAAAETLVKDHAMDRAVIVPERAAELYGLDILARDVHDNKSNHTRFHVIANEDHPKTGDDATKIMFEYNDVGRPGLLHEVTGVIYDINMRYLQLLPVNGSLRRVSFFIDLEGHRTDPKLSSVIDSIRSMDCISRVDVTGSYPVYPHEE